MPPGLPSGSQISPRQCPSGAAGLQGDVYTGLAVEDFSEADFDFAQAHLRMLSGLYGVLRPLDLMMPYRLEMGTRLDNDRGKDLYQFWGEVITTTSTTRWQPRG